MTVKTPKFSTVAADGSVRHWGTCQCCGYVSELPSESVVWDFLSLCSGCEGDYCPFPRFGRAEGVPCL